MEKVHTEIKKKDRRDRDGTIRCVEVALSYEDIRK
jgi:hypothetical protein